MRRCVLLLIAILSSALPAWPARAAIQTRHVLVVVIDGGRYSETLGEPGTPHHPHMAGELSLIGARPAGMFNLGPTITVPGMSGILTGAIQDIRNDGTERPHTPTVGEVLRKQRGVPDSLVRIVARKPKLEVVGHSDHPQYGAAYGAAIRAGFNSDLETYVAGRQELLQYKPTFMLIHFGDTDYEGHANDWPGYLESITRADSLIWQLWLAVESDPELAGRTTMFVTNDHGRHDTLHGGFQNHGDGCPGCRRIELMVVGPDSKAGYMSPASFDQRGVAMTAAHLLGVTIPTATGEPMDDILLEITRPLDVPGGGRAAPALALAPNPTQGPVRIRVDAAHAGDAQVEVLDTTGRRIARAVRAGNEFMWDGRDASGRTVAPGAYHVRVRAHGQQTIAPLVVIH
ncbi:MAG: alkaline phosphatase family protein [Candidatus Eisenbacteria bacterium]|nr:alkaline phosphatase family protein [Candidatus Eisenbacteria bacterium]